MLKCHWAQRASEGLLSPARLSGVHAIATQTKASLDSVCRVKSQHEGGHASVCTMGIHDHLRSTEAVLFTEQPLICKLA
jgi:hypothetical protein